MTPLTQEACDGMGSVLTEGSFQAAKRLTRRSCKASDVTLLEAGQRKPRCLTRAENAREAGGKDAVQPPGPCLDQKAATEAKSASAGMIRAVAGGGSSSAEELVAPASIRWPLTGQLAGGLRPSFSDTDVEEALEQRSLAALTIENKISATASRVTRTFNMCYAVQQPTQQNCLKKCHA